MQYGVHKRVGYIRENVHGPKSVVCLTYHSLSGIKRWHTGKYSSVATSNDKTTLNDKISLSVRLMI